MFDCELICSGVCVCEVKPAVTMNFPKEVRQNEKNVEKCSFCETAPAVFSSLHAVLHNANTNQFQTSAARQTVLISSFAQIRSEDIKANFSWSFQSLSLFSFRRRLCFPLSCLSERSRLAKTPH